MATYGHKEEKYISLWVGLSWKTMPHWYQLKLRKVLVSFMFAVRKLYVVLDLAKVLMDRIYWMGCLLKAFKQKKPMLIYVDDQFVCMTSVQAVSSLPSTWICPNAALWTGVILPTTALTHSHMFWICITDWVLKKLCSWMLLVPFNSLSNIRLLACDLYKHIAFRETISLFAMTSCLLTNADTADHASICTKITYSFKLVSLLREGTRH